VWVDERGGAGVHEAIYKFSNDGKQKLLDLRDPRPVSGETDAQGRVPPARDNPNPGPFDFGQNAVLAFLPNGDFLIGDGYQNGRVIRFNAAGEFVSEFGSVGSGPGQFDLIHGIAVDRNNRIYVSDRMNHRIQIFQEDGTLVDTWPNIWDPVAIMVDQSDQVWVLDATLNRILHYDINGQLQDYFGTYGEVSSLGRPGFTCSEDADREAAGVADFHTGACGGFSLPHQMSVDSEGNVYVAQFGGPWIDKYVPRSDADPSRLIGQPLVVR
jgi:sugar lactone lactonase YvrE